LKKIRQKHSLAIRWLHWINFPLLTIMIWSGILIYWGNDVYKLGWGDKTLLKFFPDSFNKALNIPFRLAEGMNLHFFFMWFFTINGLIYFFYLLFSKEYKLIFPSKNSLKEAGRVLLHTLKIKKGLPPQKKYNAAQRIAYTGTIVLGFGITVTGLAIYKPAQLYWLCNILGGYEWARIEHFVITILFVLFFVIHLIQVMIAGRKNFIPMLTGFEVVKENITQLKKEEGEHV
jgi:thiosulfate reductase cytochrome b subunit